MPDAEIIVIWLLDKDKTPFLIFNLLQNRTKITSYTKNIFTINYLNKHRSIRPYYKPKKTLGIN